MAKKEETKKDLVKNNKEKMPKKKNVKKEKKGPKESYFKKVNKEMKKSCRSVKGKIVEIVKEKKRVFISFSKDVDLKRLRYS